jgi:hypothetical protein
VLAVYGERAYAAARESNAQLHWYATIALPQQRTPALDANLRLQLCRLAGRAAVIWPEPGEAGLERARSDAAMLTHCSLTAVGIVESTEFNLAGPLPAGAPNFVLRALADAALRRGHACALPPLAGRGARAVAPWPHAADLPQVFDGVCAFLSGNLAEPRPALETIALWCLHAWCIRAEKNAFDVSPRLILRAIDAHADHARALRLIAWLTPSPLVLSRALASHLLAALEQARHTLLIDDIAGGTLYRREMRALLGAGAYRDGTFLTARTKANESGRGHCFAPTAIATASVLPDDIRLRAIVIPMAPAPADSSVARLNLIDPPAEVLTLRAQMQAAASVIAPGAEAALSRTLSRAARENWYPLFAIARRCGDGVAARAAEAAAMYAATEPPPASNLALLRDIRDMCAVCERDRLTSNALLSKLTADADRPWATVAHGHPLTPRGLAERLAGFGVRPTIVRTAEGQVARGYRGEALIDAFSRFLAATPPAFDTLEDTDALQATSM